MIARFNAFVPGVPIPQGSKKLVGPWRMVDDNLKLAPWRKHMKQTFEWMAKIQGIKEPWDGPVGYKATYYFPAPAKYLRKNGTRKRAIAHTAEDMDKLHRAVWDSLQSARVITNDARIGVTERCAKEWCRKGQEPGVMVELWQIEDSGDLQPPDHSSSNIQTERRKRTHGQEAVREGPQAYEEGSREEEAGGEETGGEVSSTAVPE